MKCPQPDKDSEDFRKQPMLLRVAWERIILDEAHNIKNYKSLTAMAVCRLRALYRWALTGKSVVLFLETLERNVVRFELSGQ